MSMILDFARKYRRIENNFELDLRDDSKSIYTKNKSCILDNFSSLLAHGSSKYLNKEWNKCLEISQVRIDETPIHGFWKSYLPAIRITICFSCNQLVYIESQIKNIRNYNHIGMERHWASHCTGNIFCGVNYNEYLKIKQNFISRYNYDNEYTSHHYGLWMQNAIRRVKHARETGKKIQACIVIQRKWLKIFYKLEDILRKIQKALTSVYLFDQLKNGSYKFHNKLEMPFYISPIIIPNCDYKLFEKITKANSHCQMNLIRGTLEIMPLVSNDTEAILNYQVTSWCLTNANLVGQFSSSTISYTNGAYTLPDIINDSKPTILGSDTSVVLSARWNALSPVAPNFVIELRSMSQPSQDFHKKMLIWINGGVESRMANTNEFHLHYITSSYWTRNKYAKYLLISLH
ncbi:hypothetical protein Glove_134g260 [Diversispora epigaea]|uniref:Putative restriction endonuclease domain-containing protein n=1 Tax=Diversispora epigaea TaxID=1348612 RepID=A0A397J3F4_9GLOM|nr:hypothetical protein Glove_134g260 [Diversispora epigaea]